MGRSARCRRGHRRRERNDRVLQVKSRRLLIRTRDGEKLPFLEEPAQKGERYRGAIIPETVGKNHRWMPGKIGGNELRKIRRARGADDNVDGFHELVPFLNRDGPQTIGVDVIDGRDEARSAKRIRPIELPLLNELFVAIGSRELVERCRGLSIQDYPHWIVWRVR